MFQGITQNKGYKKMLFVFNPRDIFLSSLTIKIAAYIFLIAFAVTIWAHKAAMASSGPITKEKPALHHIHLDIPQDIQKQLDEDFFKVKKYDGDQLIRNLEVETMNRDPAFLIQDKHKLTIINFWAPWCGVCMVELPSLTLLQKNRPDVHIIFVAENRNGFADVEKIYKDIGLPFENSFYDNRTYIKRWLDVKTFPTSIIVNPEGQVMYRLEGDGKWNDAYIQKFLDLLEQPAIKSE
ncbi:MAG: TlpA disulfide reductase family protein [Alphaproteobacteria bacterium]|nr:TlpA disulfide reductase family protein [Alphaproteobacteria bacterium]